MTAQRIALAVALAVAVGIAVLALRPLDPPAPASDGTAPMGGAIVQVALPAGLSEMAQTGKRAFDATCAACHGADAAGVEALGPPLVHKIYEPSHHGDAAFLLAVRNGVRAHHWRFGNMPPQPGLTDAEVTAITAYVRELQRANGIF